MPQDIKLRANTGAEDVALISPGFRHSIFAKEPHMAVSDFAIEKKEIEAPNGGTVLSSRSVFFDLEKDGTFLSNISLEFTAPALTIPVDGTFIRYQDCGLAHLKQDIRFSYSSSTIYNEYPDELYSEYRFRNDEKQRIFESLTKTNLSAAQRNTLALNPQKIRIPINTPWKGKGNDLPIVALANKIRLTFTFNDVQAVIQTDGTKPIVPLNYTDVKLVYWVGHIPGNERIEASNMTLTPSGCNTMFSDVLYTEVEIPANALNSILGYPIDLKDFVGAVRHIRGFIRDTDQLDPLNANTAYYEFNPAYLNGLTYRIAANERSLFELTATDTDQLEYNDMFYDCGTDTDQFYVFWDVVHSNCHIASGHINMSNFTGARLYLRNNGLVHPTLRIALLGYRWNWTNQKNGNYQKIWQ